MSDDKPLLRWVRKDKPAPAIVAHGVGQSVYCLADLGNGNWYVSRDGRKVTEGGLERCVNACEERERKERDALGMRD